MRHSRTPGGAMQLRGQSLLRVQVARSPHRRLPGKELKGRRNLNPGREQQQEPSGGAAQETFRLPGRLWRLGAEAWEEVLPPDSWPLKWLRDGVMMWPKNRKGLRRRGLPNKFRNKQEEQWALRQLLRLANEYGVVEECNPENGGGMGVFFVNSWSRRMIFGGPWMLRCLCFYNPPTYQLVPLFGYWSTR